MQFDCERFAKVVSVLPRCSSVPLLLLYWADDHKTSPLYNQVGFIVYISFDAMQIKSRLQLESLLQRGFLSSFEIRCLGTLEDPHSSLDGYSNLRDAMQWLGGEVKSDPHICYNAFDGGFNSF